MDFDKMMNHWQALEGVYEHLDPYVFGSIKFFRNAIKITLANEFGEEELEFHVKMESLTPELRTVIYKVHIALAKELRDRGFMDDLADQIKEVARDHDQLSETVSDGHHRRQRGVKLLVEAMKGLNVDASREAATTVSPGKEQSRDKETTESDKGTGAKGEEGATDAN